MALKQLKKVVVQFAPLEGSSRSAREFLARLSSSKARASNPDCELHSRVRLKGAPFIEVTYNNDKVENIPCANLSVQNIMETISAQSKEMDISDSLKKAGFADVKLHSSFSNSERLESGARAKILPR